MVKGANRAARRAAKHVEAPATQETPTTETQATEPKAKSIRYATRTWTGTDVISLLKRDAKGPADKSASSHRYTLYQDGMTVDEYVKAVVEHPGFGKKQTKGSKTLANNDLRWDTARNFISIAPKA